MNHNQRSIKQDLLYLYKALYQSPSLFGKNITNRLKYLPNEVEQALELENDNNDIKRCKKRLVKPKEEANTSQITNIDQLRNFYFSELKQLYGHSVDESLKSEILKAISLDELKRLYAIISSVQLSHNTRKKEIVDMIRYFFKDESRTNNIMRN